MHIYKLADYQLSYCLYHNVDTYKFSSVCFDTRSKYLALICDNAKYLYIIKLKTHGNVCHCHNHEDRTEEEEEQMCKKKEKGFFSLFKRVKVYIGNFRQNFWEMDLKNLPFILLKKINLKGIYLNSFSIIRMKL
jgi:hypothetical protein